MEEMTAFKACLLCFKTFTEDTPPLDRCTNSIVWVFFKRGMCQLGSVTTQLENTCDWQISQCIKTETNEVTDEVTVQFKTQQKDTVLFERVGLCNLKK